MVDCAYCYGNEDEVGLGLKEAFDAGVKRDDVFIMTKVWATYNTRVAENLEKSLKSLGVDYVDMYLIVSCYRSRRDKRQTWWLTETGRSTGLFY